MATPEGKVKDKVKALLKQHEPDCYYFMPVQNGMGKPGLDFHCHMKGFAFYIETKAPGKKLTPRQELTKQEMEEAGAPVFVVGERKIDDKDFPYSGMEKLAGWLTVRAVA